MGKRKFSTLIVDDEPSAITNLVEDLGLYSDIIIDGTFTSSLEAEAAILEIQPDLLFLDMEMPERNGIELLQSVRDSVPGTMYVVFYSGYDRYMMDAIRNSAFDFLLKPYKREELDVIINRLREMPEGSMKFEDSMQHLLNEDRKFALQTMTKLLFLRFSEILFFQYIEENRCWQVMLTNMNCHRLRLNIKAKDILQMSASFIRINSSCILNVEYLSSIENRSMKCILYAPFTHIELFASRRFFTKIKDALELL